MRASVSEPIEPMTLGNMRADGVHRLAASSEWPISLSTPALPDVWQPQTNNGRCGNQPADKSLINRRLKPHRRPCAFGRKQPLRPGGRFVARPGDSGHKSYFAASCGGAPISIIRQYIEQQRVPDYTGADAPCAPISGVNAGACGA